VLAGTVQVVLCDLGVGVWPGEPELHAAARVLGQRGVLIGPGPDVLTQGLGRWEEVCPLATLGVHRTSVSS